MNVGIATVSSQASTQSSKTPNDVKTNRSSFLDMLTQAQGTTEIAIEPLKMSTMKSTSSGIEDDFTGDVFSKLLQSLQGKDANDLFAPNLPEISDEMVLESEEVLKLLDLLPEYLRADVEQLLRSGEALNFLEGNQTLAQLLALFMSIANSRITEGDKSLENLRNQIQQALKAESQLTGLNPSEILTKLDRLMTSNENQTKQDYLLGLMQRMALSSNRQSEQTGLNIGSVTDPSQTMSRAQQLVIHIGEQPTKEAEQRQFVRQFQDILGRGMLKQLNNGVSQLTIKLYPQHLGRLDIQLVQMQGVITAKITATTSAAREMIEGQLQQLRNAFSQQQLNVERVEVHQQQNNNQLNKDGQNKQQQEKNNKNDSNEDELSLSESSFDELLEELSINEKV